LVVLPAGCSASNACSPSVTSARYDPGLPMASHQPSGSHLASPPLGEGGDARPARWASEVPYKPVPSGWVTDAPCRPSG
jgi:hypothetical protein